MPILEVQDIHTYYGDAYVLQGLSLKLEQGQILGLLGRNGVGKTTLVNSIVGFTPPRRGKIVFKGEEITNNSSHYSIPLVVGRRIAQIIFFETGPILEKDYTKLGKYQSSTNLKDLKKDWKPESMLPKLYNDRDIKKGK